MNTYSFLLQRAFLLLLIALCTPNAFSNSSVNSSLPGIFESLEILNGHWKEYFNESIREKNNNLGQNNKTLSEKNSSKNSDVLYLDPSYLAFLSFYLTKQQRALLNYRPCHLMDLLWLGEINLSRKPLKQVLVSLSSNSTSSKNENKTQWMDVAQFASESMQSLCPESATLAYQSSGKQLEQTLQSIKPIITQFESCHQEVEKFWKSPQATYWCYFSERKDWTHAALMALKNTASNSQQQIELYKKAVASGLKVKSLVNDEALFQLSSLCQFSEKPQEACNELFSGNFFKLMITKNKSIDEINKICVSEKKSVPKSQSKNETSQLSTQVIQLSTQALKNCSDDLFSNPDKCLSLMPELGGPMPRSDCQELSLSLVRTKIPFELDCTNQTTNVAITNLSRLLYFFENEVKTKWPNASILASKDDAKKDLSDKNLNTSKDNSNSSLQCGSHHSSTVLQFFNQIGVQDFWSREVCLQDPLKKSEYCDHYLITTKKVSPQFAVPAVMERLLRKKFNVNRTWECQLVEEKSFDKDLLKFKSGCWILFDENNISQDEGTFNYAIDGRLQDANSLKFKGFVHFPYDEVTANDQYHHALYLLTRELKLETKNLTNAAELANFYKDHPNGLIQGVGCLHQLYQQHAFSTEGIRDCKPVPFIIGATIEKSRKSDLILILHTALDPQAFPRAIPWQELIASVRSYQRFHPQQLWSLYGMAPKK